MMITLHGVTHAHPNKDILFQGLNLSVQSRRKSALIGNNGAGKSTLLNIIAGNLQPLSGSVYTESKPLYIPQLTSAFDSYTVAQVLKVDKKLDALKAILSGDAKEQDLLTLDDDWLIEERCVEALAHWQLSGLDLNQQLNSLSGGQKTKVFLAAIDTVKPEIVLLDEPSNHLDNASRQILYDYIRNSRSTMLAVSHDRTLLNLLNEMIEISPKGVSVYGGNYDFYYEQKQIERQALDNDLKSKERALKIAKDIEREASERQQKLNARGKGKQEKAGMPRIMMNTLRNNAERSTAKLKGAHAEKIDNLSGDLAATRERLGPSNEMKLDLDNSQLHAGKTLVSATNINFNYGDAMLWPEPLNFRITSGQRLSIEGNNGSGKSTLVKIILGQLKPSAGVLESSKINSIYIDQDYSLINPALTVLEQAQLFNTGILQEHEIKIRLNRFLFSKESWDKPCSALSGGERMRLALCCIMVGQQAPDMIVLDEPTNNLDIANVEILSSAINDYKGSLLVVSHDENFLKAIGIEETISLSRDK